MAANQSVTAYLGGVPFRTGPSEVRWNFTMKMSEQKCIGGKVIQILGCTLGDMTVSGRFGSGKQSEEGNWEEQWRVRERIIKWSRNNEAAGGNKAIRFIYPPRNWDFQVFIKSWSPMQFANDDIAPQWEFVFVVDEEGARDVAKGIKDLYIRRLMDGVGWKQSSYNGPTDAEYEALLAGGTVGDYLAAEAQRAFESGLAGGQIGAHTL